LQEEFEGKLSRICAGFHAIARSALRWMKVSMVFHPWISCLSRAVVKPFQAILRMQIGDDLNMSVEKERKG
jgi:hypothetical protein